MKKTSPNTDHSPLPTAQPKKPASFWLSWVLGALLIALFAGFSYWRNVDKPKVNILTKEGVITKIQTLNRLQTVAYNIDSVITSEKQGNWYALWQDKQKGLFVAHGRVTAGIDLNLLKPENVQVTNEGKNVTITLPPAQVLDTYLDSIEVYDIQTGVFGMVEADPQIFNQAQISGKQQVLSSACRSNILKIATENAQKQVQSLFALANVQVTINTVTPKSCA